MKVTVMMPSGLVIRNEFAPDEDAVIVIEPLQPGDEVFVAKVSGVTLLNKTKNGLRIESMEIES